ncbi:ArsR/SmtB family transcription factor [Actinocatenispora rupis]|uniref:Transcriptional regulator n=1 Tax=Actinocatenispora rupis TaxID=519421 RepID=A0A8J3J0W3_9ACTN|nr:winged helix-turn-helix domain-containing protein [Actinocatenispora rupis]GID10000.1 transcriptional regulator [Actinocatenispora rupis]
MTEQPPAEEITDAAALRLLAHPIRRRIEACLRDGPANSAQVARQLGESTGLVSYHLRQMARHGFIEEVPELAKGRERWWRPVPGDRRIPPYSRQDAAMRAASAQLARQHLAELIEQYERFEAGAADLGEWADAFVFSRATIHLELPRMKEFFEEYIALLYRYSEPADSPGTRAVALRLFGFPQPPDD